MLPITVAARSEAWTVFACSNTGIVRSNPTRGMDVCLPLLCLCCHVKVAALRQNDPPSKVSYRYIGLRNWKSGQGPKGCTAIERERGGEILIFTLWAKIAQSVWGQARGWAVGVVLGLTQPPIRWIRGSLSPGKSSRGVKLTTHPHVVPRLSTVVLYNSTLPYGFMAWCLIN
jgi:hypothetical protein